MTGIHEHVKDTKWNDDDGSAKLGMDFRDLTNILAVRQSKSVNAGCRSTRYDFKQSHIIQKQALDSNEVPTVYIGAVKSACSKEWFEAMCCEITSLEKVGTWSLVNFVKSPKVIETK